MNDKILQLTIREIECLSIIKFGGSNNSIATMLGISVGTVKYHILNLKNKLGCSTRRDMIQIANDQSFLSIFNIIAKI